VGIRLNIRSYEWQTFYSDIIKGNFQIYLLRFIGATDPDIYRYCFHSGSVPPNGANRGAYSNPRLDKLIEKAMITLDKKERKGITNLILYPNANFKYLKDVVIKR